MNRWSEEFDNNPFHNIWGVLMRSLDEISLGAEVSSEIVGEYSRAKKVTILIDSTVQSLDKEVFHLQTFANAIQPIQQAQASLNQFKADTNNLLSIQAVNNQMDQLLNFFRPYMMMPDAVAKAIKRTATSQKKILETINKTIIDTSQERLASLRDLAEEASNLLSQVKATTNESKQLNEKLFGNGEQRGLSQEIEGFRAEIQESRDNALSTVETLKIQEESVIENSNSIENYKAASKINKDEISELLDATESELAELKSFFIKVFGKKDEEGSFTTGLTHELEEYKEGILEYESTQKTKLKELTSEIERLLPGAISAGLASAYRSLKEECDEPIKKFTAQFYGALTILLTTGFVGFFFATKGDGGIESLIYNFLQASPIVIPAIWFAVFTSRRRNDFQRLKQEYAHKEAVTSSYQSFKQQIDKLDENQSEMSTSLLKAAIKTIEYNASHALDGTKQESSPLFETIENVASRAKTKITGIKD